MVMLMEEALVEESVVVMEVPAVFQILTLLELVSEEETHSLKLLKPTHPAHLLTLQEASEVLAKLFKT